MLCRRMCSQVNAKLKSGGHIPVSNDDVSVDVSATVSGNDATIKPLDDKQIEQLVGDSAAGDIVIDLTELGKEIANYPIDVAFVGIGENGHIAFNDPPADFETERAYLVINLDEACRNQQLGEGWFPTFDAVPKQAISMSVKQIMKSAAIINTVPDKRKAKAVKGALEGPVSNLCPSSIMQKHPDCTTFLDKDSASLLTKKY